MKINDIVKEKDSNIPLKIVNRYKDIYINSQSMIDPHGKYVEVVVCDNQSNKAITTICLIEDLVKCD